MEGHRLPDYDRGAAIATRDLKRFLSEPERDRLIDCLAFSPESGDVIPGTEGIRKFRWPYQLKGKSKGLRIIYYFRDLNMPLYILAVYSKGQILRLTKREERAMTLLVRQLVQEHAERNLSRANEEGLA